MRERHSREFWAGRADRLKQRDHERKGHDKRSLLRPWSLFETGCYYRPPKRDRIGRKDYNTGWRSRG